MSSRVGPTREETVMSIWIGGGGGRFRIDQKKKDAICNCKEYPLPPLQPWSYRYVL